jgi:hypothetical protein
MNFERRRNPLIVDQREGAEEILQRPTAGRGLADRTVSSSQIFDRHWRAVSRWRAVARHAAS